MRTLAERGLNHGTAGNVSLRTSDGLLITPSGIPAPRMDEGSLVSMTLDGRVATGQRAPSSEWPLHAAIYRARADVDAVVHVHSPWATAVACTRQALPPLHYAVALSGQTEVPCAPYATFGSTELADAVVATLGASGRACLMANHGLVCAAATLEAAMLLAEEVEFLCQVYILSRQAGAPILLGSEEMRKAFERVARYGQPAGRGC